MILSLVITAIFVAPLLAACYTDFSEMKIPNWVSAAALVGFAAALPFTWAGLEWFGEHMAVGGLLFAFGFVLWMIGGLGAGDVKLMGAVGLWFGFAEAIHFVLYTTLFGAALGLFLLLGRRFVPVRLEGTVLVDKMFQGKTHMPYGIAIAAGALTVWPTSQIALALAG